MAEKPRSTRPGSPGVKAPAGGKAQGSSKPAGTGSEDRGLAVWIRDDGAFCVGDECIVMQHKADRFEVTVDPTRCGPAGAELLKQLTESIGMGQPTHYVVKASIEEPT